MNVRRAIFSALGALVVFLALVLLLPEQRIVLLNIFMAYLALTLSLDLLVGQVNMLSAGHAAFFGAGAYLAVIMHIEWGLSYPIAAVLAILIVTILALLLGYPATGRTSGMHFAIVTFAFGELLVQVVLNRPFTTGGTEGMSVRWGLGEQFPFDWSIYRYFGVWYAFVVAFIIGLCVLIRRSQFGLRLRAIKENENVVRSLGFNPTLYKTAIFGIAAFMAALVGTLFAPMSGFVSPSMMEVHVSVLILGLLLVGGMNRMAGPFLGVGLLYILPEIFHLDPTLRTVIIGGFMAVVVLFEPSGIAGVLARWGAQFRGRFTDDDAGEPDEENPLAASDTLETGGVR